MTSRPAARDIDKALDYGRADYLQHLKTARSLERAGNMLQGALGTVRMALVSSFTLDPLVPCLRARAAGRGLTVEPYLAPYGQYRQEILAKDSGLARSAPEITLLWVDPENIFPQLFCDPYSLSAAAREREAATAVAEFAALIGQLRQRVDGLIVICNFPAPLYTEMGILEGNREAGIVQTVVRANRLLQEAVNNLPSTYVFDLQGTAQRFGQERAFDRKLANYANIPVSMDFMVRVAHELLGYLLPLKGVIRKCLVLDLDNTVWGGIVGETGWAEVAIGHDTPAGRAFTDFQRMLLRFFHRGLILAVNSKNNRQDALEVFEKRSEMILRPEHFAAMRINWQDKATNMRSIAEELNIGLDSLVFLDDNPHERELIRELLPQVLVPELTAQPDGYADQLASLVDLNVLELTEEDLRKGALYSQQSERHELQQETPSLQDYLSSLDTVVRVRPATPATYSRLAQLSQKTNQFNLTTHRYSVDAIRAFAETDQVLVHSLDISDRIGDLGIVGLSITKETTPGAWELDTFLLSCRCIGRNAEEAFLDAILSDLRETGAASLALRYIPSARNAVVREFLQRLGMPDGEETLELEPANVLPLTPAWIRRE